MLQPFPEPCSFFGITSLCPILFRAFTPSRQRILVNLDASKGLREDPTSPFLRRSVLGVLWKDWCWGWNSNTLATSCKELTHWKRPWCWEGLGAGGGDDRGWDGWLASPTRWTWVWVNSGSWWWTGRPGVLRSVGLQRVGRDPVTELNWTGTEDYALKTNAEIF